MSLLYVLADEWIRQRQVLAALSGLLSDPNRSGDPPVDPQRLDTMLADLDHGPDDVPARATDPAERAEQVAAFMAGMGT